jgi:hypothetical protein
MNIRRAASMALHKEIASHFEDDATGPVEKIVRTIKVAKGSIDRQIRVAKNRPDNLPLS